LHFLPSAAILAAFGARGFTRLRGGLMADPRRVIERQIAAFNGRREDDFPWADDFELVAPGAELRGRAEVLPFFRGFWEAFPDVRIEVVRLVVQDATAAGEGRFAGTHTGTLRTPAGDVEATNRAVEFGWMAMYEFGEDVLLSEHLYFDQAGLLGQLGITPG
jgi:hypothetical protein